MRKLIATIMRGPTKDEQNTIRSGFLVIIILLASLAMILVGFTLLGKLAAGPLSGCPWGMQSGSWLGIQTTGGNMTSPPVIDHQCYHIDYTNDIGIIWIGGFCFAVVIGLALSFIWAVLYIVWAAFWPSHE